MSYTVKIVNSEGIPQQYRDNASKCFMCGEEVINGGTWAGLTGDHLVTVCNNGLCIEDQIKWVIDSFSSVESIDIRHFKTKKEFLDLVEKVYDEKAIHPNHN